jgi:hypothetical protein
MLMPIDENDLLGQEPREVLVVYSTKCFTCSHLVDDAPNRNMECHYSNGNRDCPAVALRVITTGKVQQYLKRLELAQQNKDAAEVAKIWEEIGKQSPEFQQRMFAVTVL